VRAAGCWCWCRRKQCLDPACLEREITESVLIMPKGITEPA
jgi:hypothetical protein